MSSVIKNLQKSLIGRLHFVSAKFGSNYMFPLLVLFMRVWMARVFWYSGLTKISSWQSTIYLFKYEYAVPIIPAELAAMLATELFSPILLVLGFVMRLAAIPMICMTAVI